MRQDCLVEQLFSIVNSILNGDEDAAFLRTYKVGFLLNFVLLVVNYIVLLVNLSLFS